MLIQDRGTYYGSVAPDWWCQLRMYHICGGVTMATVFEELSQGHSSVVAWSACCLSKISTPNNLGNDHSALRKQQ